MARRYLGDEGSQQFLAAARQTFSGWARIKISPRQGPLDRLHHDVSERLVSTRRWCWLKHEITMQEPPRRTKPARSVSSDSISSTGMASSHGLKKCPSWSRISSIRSASRLPCATWRRAPSMRRSEQLSPTRSAPICC